MTTQSQDLEGRVAVITGAGSGIGRAASVLFEQHGARVCLIGRTAETLEETKALLRAPDDALVRTIDVGDEAAIDAVIGECERTLGVPDVLFSNAGVIVVKPAIEQTVEDWEHVLRVNLLGGVMLAKRMIPGMQSLGRGSIVFTGSIDGMFGDYQVSAYTASKGAVHQFVRSLALEHAKDNIRVNAIAPGITATKLQMSVIESMADPASAFVVRSQQTPIGRMIQPEEAAESALFLASDRSQGVTGHMLVVDGGITAAWIEPPAAYLPPPPVFDQG